MKFILFLLLPVGPAYGLTAEDVTSSSMQHFPQIIEAVQRLEEAEQDTRAAEGAFDAKLKGETDSRTEGYYSGDAYKVSVEKPIPYFGSRIYGGKRQSYGTFPSYEGKQVTLDDGEFFAGASVSLLRNSLIDSNRYNIRLRRQDQLQANKRLRLMQINVQTMALKAYWTWLIKGRELEVYKNILNLANTRATQISKRIKAGDLARIYKVENDQYIRKRESQVIQSQIEFQQACFYLGLFYRDKQGRPQKLTTVDLPKFRQSKLAKIANTDAIYSRSLQENLDLQIMSSQMEQAELKIRMGRNEILPRVDVNFEWNQDQAPGPNPAVQNENRIMLNVEIPIEYNKGIGKKRAGEAKLNQLKTKSSWIKDKLSAEVRALVLKLNSFANMFELTTDQVTFADRLAKAERRKFSQGASDLILVNIREENMAQAQIKNLNTLLKYQFVDADIKNVKVQFVTSPDVK